ncbi:hypothetical protein Bpfe_020458, partial [Biomphalaria pfeifferi]
KESWIAVAHLLSHIVQCGETHNDAKEEMYSASHLDRPALGVKLSYTLFD